MYRTNIYAMNIKRIISRLECRKTAFNYIVDEITKIKCKNEKLAAISALNKLLKEEQDIASKTIQSLDTLLNQL